MVEYFHSFIVVTYFTDQKIKSVSHISKLSDYTVNVHNWVGETLDQDTFQLLMSTSIDTIHPAPSIYSRTKSIHPHPLFNYEWWHCLCNRNCIDPYLASCMPDIVASYLKTGFNTVVPILNHWLFLIRNRIISRTVLSHQRPAECTTRVLYPGWPFHTNIRHGNNHIMNQ